MKASGIIHLRKGARREVLGGSNFSYLLRMDPTLLHVEPTSIVGQWLAKIGFAMEIQA